MAKQIYAIANCRVSSDEQLENNSLARQRDQVLAAAKELGAIIPEDGWWSGSVSSKRGTNLSRNDLKEMLTYCRAHKAVKYLIVDEPDRFMRSIDEAAYFEVSFRELGVTVWYASDPELNKGDLASKLLKFTKYMSAEGSNEERINKSINGQVAALKQGKWPFNPKPGYKRGYENAIPEIDPVKGPILQNILRRLAVGVLTPQQALKELNSSNFVKGKKKPYTMDLFEKMAIDSFYIGVVEMDKQVKYRNENGLHKALLTKDEHEKLVKIFAKRPKYQIGERKNENPEYGANNIIDCSDCLDKKQGRFVGFPHTNGKSEKVYKRYRCRACNKYLHRDDLHAQIVLQFKKHPITHAAVKDLSKALKQVWGEKRRDASREQSRLEAKITLLEEKVKNQIEALTDPQNELVQDDIRGAISTSKKEIENIRDEIDKLAIQEDSDLDEFLEFAFDFIAQMGKRFFEVSKENRIRCKQLAFPGGIQVDSDKKVYTPEISELFRLGTSKKDPSRPSFNDLVRVTGL